MINKELVIIGAGPAGLAASVSAYDNGIKDLLIVERDSVVGGILNQCIHNGFGLTRFKENLTGPEYAQKFIEEVERRNIEILLNTTVLNLSEDKAVTLINSENGIFEIKAKAVILAMGCRERPKGALNIAGFRPSGLLSAGTAQKYININGLSVGKKIMILGSGDIGLIMARRLTLEGAKVLAVCEIMPYSGGLKRNIVQCLDDFNIPLLLSHTIIKIHGINRVEGVTIAKVDEQKKPIKGTEKYIMCDTVLFSVGLIPENELAKTANIELSLKTRGAIVNEKRETSVEGIFACGNVLHVHDLVDFVSEEAELAGKYAAKYILCSKLSCEKIRIIAAENVSYVVPQKISTTLIDDVKLFFRPSVNLKNVTVEIKSGEKMIYRKKIIAVTPGEMESVVLKSENLIDLNGELSVNLRGEKL